MLITDQTIVFSWDNRTIGSGGIFQNWETSAHSLGRIFTNEQKETKEDSQNKYLQTVRGMKTGEWRRGIAENFSIVRMKRTLACAWPVSGLVKYEVKMFLNPVPGTRKCEKVNNQQWVEIDQKYKAVNLIWGTVRRWAMSVVGENHTLERIIANNNINSFVTYPTI